MNIRVKPAVATLAAVDIPRKGHLRPDDKVPVSRILPSPPAEPLARWFWVPEWDLPHGVVHEALTLPFPACQLVVEPDGVVVHGPGHERLAP